MAYLTKLRKGGKVYYYLAENIRLAAGRRKQVRKYVGTEKPSETRLQTLMAQFEEEVETEQTKSQGRHYLTQDEITEADRINKEFWGRYHKQTPSVREQFDQNFVMAFVYNTNSIEGSTLSPKEVELLLSENISPNKPLDDVLEAKAAQRTLQFVKEHPGDLDEDLALKIHERYFKDTKPKIAGQYKTHQNRVSGSRFELTPPQYVLPDMKNYFQEYQKLKKELCPLELAAWAHWKLVRIHPFQDGNGRTARIVMNFVLNKHGYAMIDIKTKEKQQYFNALEKCHYNNNARALAVRLVRRFKKQYLHALENE